MKAMEWMARMIWWSNSSSPFYTRREEMAAIAAATPQSRIYRIFRRKDRQRRQRRQRRRQQETPTTIREHETTKPCHCGQPIYRLPGISTYTRLNTANANSYD